MDKDKALERQRYDDRAKGLLSDESASPEITGSTSVAKELQAPYLYYESMIRKYSPGSGGNILEIDAGTGAFTRVLLSTGANVCATDISEYSLGVIRDSVTSADRLQTRVADMESLPFKDAEFDIVASAGSLSYGDNKLVMDEIYRVLKSEGVFICVDTLNHNPVYRLNRWLHYLRKNRTLSTLKRMPTVTLLKSYENKFGEIDVFYFGAISWLAPILKKICSVDMVARLSNRFDTMFNVKRSAFKFVMLAKKIK